MKKLICAAVVAGSMFAMAEESANKDAVRVVQAKTGEAVEVAPKRPQISAEQRAKMREQREKMREQREKFMAEHKAKQEAQILEIVKKYIPEEEKAKALVKELQDAKMAGRRDRMRAPRPSAAKPAEAK